MLQIPRLRLSTTMLCENFLRADSSLKCNAILGLLVLAGDILAIINIVQSAASNEKKQMSDFLIRMEFDLALFLLKIRHSPFDPLRFLGKSVPNHFPEIVAQHAYGSESLNLDNCGGPAPAVGIDLVVLFWGRAKGALAEPQAMLASPVRYSL